MKSKKIRNLLLISTIFIVLLWLGYPMIKDVFKKHYNSITYYEYKPQSTVVSDVDISKMPQAKAVPMLMYHGIVLKEDSQNTSLANFISQMEILKKHGYETITLEQYDKFLNDKATLPPKPIVITFDDGRKDSYYRSDSVLKELGFKATIFIVSGKQNDKDKFFLSWDELKVLRDSGRWDIQAHGTYSHNKIIDDPYNNTGYFLSSKRYKKGVGLESDDAFETRVENDFLQNIVDLKLQLGIVPKYYAIPLNDYGEEAKTNYPDAVRFNWRLMKKYFRLSFVQANSSSDTNGFYLNIYNYKDTDRYMTARIEVKDMSPDVLIRTLEDAIPAEPSYSFDRSKVNLVENAIQNSYGNIVIKDDGIHVMGSPENESARILFGDTHWANYTVEASMQRVSGRSIFLMGNVMNGSNYIAFGFTDNGIALREYVEGNEYDLRRPILKKGFGDSTHLYRLVFKGDKVSAYIDEAPVYLDVPISTFKGQVGIKVWGDSEIAEGLLQSLRVQPNK